MYGITQGVGDFLGEFNDESSKIRTANEKKNAADAEIEQRALEHLANADDPQIRAAAVTAMLTPKKATGGGGVSGLIGKWFGTQRDHPIFNQVHQLINGGGPGGAAPVQPFMSVEDKAAATTSGNIQGRIGGANEAFRNVTGENLPDADIRRGALGALGAPPSRLVPPKPGTITKTDGTTIAGFFDEESKTYQDADGTQLGSWEVASWNPAGPHAANPNAGASWQDHIPDKNSPTGYSKVHSGPDGKEIGRTTGTPPPPGPPNAIFQTPGGFTGVAPGRAGETPKVVPVAGGGVQTRTEDPSAAFTSLRQIANDANTRALASVPRFGGGAVPPDEKELAVARDREAKAVGYANWQALQDAVAAAQRAISGAVQGPPKGLELGADDTAGTGGTPAGAGGPPGGLPPSASGPVAQAGGGRGATAQPAAPATRPGTKPGAPPVATKPGATGGTGTKGKPVAGGRAPIPGKIDVNAVLAELEKLR